MKQFSLHFYLKTELESIKKIYKPKPPLEIEIVERLTTPGMRIIFALISGGFIQGASCLTLSRYSPGVQPNSRTNAL
ncbi:hypothetical protein FP514_24460 [Escherichia coli]|nr:hypothetical protein FP514_24460 [Escherichia coli]